MQFASKLAVRGVVSGWVVLFVSAIAQAALVLEFDFRADQNASFAAGGINPLATLGGSATVNAGGGAVTATLPNYIVDPRIASGYLDLPTNADRNVLSANFNSVFGTPNNFGNGTVAVVVKPDFSAGGLRRYLWGDGSDGVNNYMTVVSEGALRLTGGRGTENAFDLATTGGNFPWDPNTWYLIAASWQQSSASDPGSPTCCGDAGLADGKLRLYARALQIGSQLTPDSTAVYVANEAVPVWNTRLNPHSGTFRQGNRATFTEAGFGDYALFQYYNETFDLNDFNVLFDSFLQPVPEPSTCVMLALGSTMFVGAGRRLNRRRGC